MLPETVRDEVIFPVMLKLPMVAFAPMILLTTDILLTVILPVSTGLVANAMVTESDTLLPTITILFPAVNVRVSVALVAKIFVPFAAIVLKLLLEEPPLPIPVRNDPLPK